MYEASQERCESTTSIEESLRLLEKKDTPSHGWTGRLHDLNDQPEQISIAVFRLITTRWLPLFESVPFSSVVTQTIHSHSQCERDLGAIAAARKVHDEIGDTQGTSRVHRGVFYLSPYSSICPLLGTSPLDK